MSKEILIEGEVIPGIQLATKMGFPTVNIKYDGDLDGIFVGEILVKKEWRKCMVHAGRKPTVKDYRVSLEAHILDWGGFIHKGTKVSLKILKRIRGIKKFDNLDKLKSAITKDIEFARNWYSLRSEA
ncbi:MAG: riboflavin kinase [Candidatus Gracilibacteria bacterium]